MPLVGKVPGDETRGVAGGGGQPANRPGLLDGRDPVAVRLTRRQVAVDVLRGRTRPPWQRASMNHWSSAVRSNSFTTPCELSFQDSADLRGGKAGSLPVPWAWRAVG